MRIPLSSEGRARGRLALLFVPLALSLSVAACGDASGGADGVASLTGDGSKKSVTTTTLSREESGLKFAQCMRDHGIEMDDPDADGRITIGGVAGGPNDPKGEQMMDAQKACQKYLAAGGGPKGAKGPSAEEQDKLLEQAQCLRDRGYDAKDPVFGEGGTVTMEAPGGADLDDEQFQKDQRECAEAAGIDLPKGGPGAGPAVVGGGPGTDEAQGGTADGGGPSLSLQTGGGE